ncbi:MAG: hypothetical protein WA958_15310 [Tunicatimonas sp.]
MELLYICLITIIPGFSHSIDDPIIDRYFTSEDAHQLDSILTFFNQQILSDCQGNKDIVHCYQEYFNRLDTSGIYTGISYEEQQDLYESIGEVLWKKIWEYQTEKKYDSTSRLVTSKELNYSLQGSYMKFLKDVAEEEPYFKQYVNPIEVSGDLSPALFKGFLYDPSGLDFSNQRHQLIIALHFLTFNDKLNNMPN